MNAPWTRVPVVSLATLALLALAGCTAWRAQALPPADAAGQGPKYARVTLASGERIDLSAPRVQADSLVGYRGLADDPWRLPPQGTRRHSRVAIAVSDIRRLDVRVTSSGRTALLVGGIAAVGALVVVAATVDPMGGGDFFHVNE